MDKNILLAFCPTSKVMNELSQSALSCSLQTHQAEAQDKKKDIPEMYKWGGMKVILKRTWVGSA